METDFNGLNGESATDSPQSSSLPIDQVVFSDRMIKTGLQILQDKCGENAKKSGWHADRPVQGQMKQDDGPIFFFDESDRFYADRLRNWQIAKIMLMVSELSEGVEELRAGHKANYTYYSGEERKPEGLPSELADCLIRILDFCFTEKIDLPAMVLEKLVFNQTRGVKHGGKAI